MYELGVFDRRKKVVSEKVSVDLTEKIRTQHKSIEVQRFLREIREDGLWVRCYCNDKAMLYPCKKGDFLTLVRMPKRGDHEDDCPYSELNSEIRRTKFVEELKGKKISFHRTAPEPSGLPSLPNISVKGAPSEATYIGKFLLTVYSKAGQNFVPLIGSMPALPDQYKKIKLTLSEYEIAGKKGKDIVFTHPSDLERAKSTLYRENWIDNQVPQVVLFFTVDTIADKKLRIKTGDDVLVLEVHSKIEYIYDDSSPPYNCLMTLCLRDVSEEPEILRCVAVPVLSNKCLLPVRNNVVRSFTEKMKEVAWSDEFYREELRSFSLLTPFFPKTMEGISFRPDFYIDKDGAGYVAIYFMSDRNDLNAGSRRDEIEFLKSMGINVEIFDLDVLYTDLGRALDVFVRRIFESYLSVFDSFN